MGAWIETHHLQVDGSGVVSHPTWVRGLKLVMTLQLLRSTLSHPTWVRGLKLMIHSELFDIFGSHPTWVRGLKPLKTYAGEDVVRRTLRGCVD